MWHAIYSLSYHMVSEWRPVFPLGKLLSAGASQKPQARPSMKKSLWGSLLEPMTGYYQLGAQHWIQWTQTTTRKGWERRRNEHCTERPRPTSFWRGGRAAKTYVLHRRRISLNTNIWQLQDTFWILMRVSKHPCHYFHVMERLHLNCSKDHLCHQLCLQRTSLEDKLMDWMSAESKETTVILWRVMWVVHQ